MLTEAEAKILVVYYTADQFMSVHQVINKANVSDSYGCKLTKRLVKKGLLETTTTPNHTTIYYVLTARGFNVAQTIHQLFTLLN